MDRYLVISSDGHAGPPAEHYRDYLEEQYRDDFDEHQAATAKMRAEMMKARGGDNSEFLKTWNEETDGDGGLLAAYESDYRNKILDIEGVAAEVLFPDADVLGTGRIAASPFGTGLGGGAGTAPHLALAGAKAHNRWLADFCKQSPDRRIGVALIPALYDIDDAVAEVEAASEMGLRGIMIPTRWFDQPAYNHPRYDPIWAAAQANGMVVHTHSGAGPSDYGDEGRGNTPIYASEAYWWAARPLAVLIWAGTFERFPDLHYVIAENGAWWAPDQLARMDAKWEGAHNTAKMGDVFRQELKMKPSDYFHRNCAVAPSTPGPEDIDRRHEVGIKNWLWGNDLPHPEGTFPFTRYWIRERLHDVPSDEARLMLGLNSANLYKDVDQAKLAPIVAEIGPTVDEVHGDTPIEPAPSF